MKDAVDRLRDQHLDAVNTGDVERATSLFAPDGVVLPPGQPALEGSEAIRGWYTQAFAGFRIQGFGLQPDSVEPHGDVMVEHGSWKAIFQPRDGSAGLPAGGTYLTIYGRVANGDVRIIRDTFHGMPA